MSAEGGKTIEVAVAVVGAGIAGTAVSAALARRGVTVAMIARSERHPPEFRAEKMGGQQMALLDGFGLGAAARECATPFDGVWLHRFGRIVDRTTEREYGSDYASLVDALRGALPPEVPVLIGRTASVATGPDRQEVTLEDGRVVRARLVVVATGLADGIRRQLGVTRQVISPAHTLAAGFYLARPASSFPFPSLVWTGERFGDGLSYLTLFPIGSAMRANLYIYRKSTDPWTRHLRDAPEEALHEVMPGFEQLFGRLPVEGPVVTRPIDLVAIRDHEREGVVFVGDAFSTVCPITGTGIDKALTDVDRLCHDHVPRWLKTPGMGREKIEAFYADPVKRARDASAVAASIHARAMKVETSLPWRLRRLRSNTVVRALYRLPPNQFVHRH